MNGNDETIMDYAAQIRAARESLGWTQSHLAAASGLPLRTVSRMELADGRPHKRTLAAVQTALAAAGAIPISEGVKLRASIADADETSRSRPISPEAVSAARMLLGWSRVRLAMQSHLNESLILKYETTGRVSNMHWQPPGFDAIGNIRSALEAAGVTFINDAEPDIKLNARTRVMSGQGDKLTSTDVQELITRANSPSPGPALAAQNILRDAVAAGEPVFVDQVSYEVAQRAVKTFLNG